MDKMEVTLLSIEDFDNPEIKRLLIDERVPNNISDLVRLNLALREYSNLFVTSSYASDDNNYSYIEPQHKKYTKTFLEHSSVVIRPVINLPSELFEKLIAKYDINNNFEIITFGYYPTDIAQTPIGVYKTNDYYSFNKFGLLPARDKFNIKNYPVYYSGEDKYLKFNTRKFNLNEDDSFFFNHIKEYIKISHVRWYVDLERKRLISEKGLITNIAWGKNISDFKNSRIYYFLNKYFLRDLLQFEKENFFEKEQEEEIFDVSQYDLKDEMVRKVLEEDILRVIRLKYDGYKSDIKRLRNWLKEYIKYRKDNPSSDYYIAFNNSPLLSELLEIEFDISSKISTTNKFEGEEKLLNDLKKFTS